MIRAWSALWQVLHTNYVSIFIQAFDVVHMPVADCPFTLLPALPYRALLLAIRHAT